MSSGFTLMLSPRVGLAERDSLQTVHKVSLVGDCTDSSKPLLSSAQENGLKGAGSELANVGRFLSEDFHSILEESDSPPAKRSDTMLVNSTYTHSSVSSTKREPVLFASHSFPPEKAPPSAVSLDTASSPGNGSCWNVRSEVQQGSESEAGRRSWAEFAAPAGGRGKGSETGITNAGSGSYAQLAESGSEYDDDFFTGIFTATRVELPASPTDTDPDPDLNMEALVDTLRSMESPSRNRTMQRASTQPFSSLPPIREDIPSPVSAPASSPTVPKETSISLPLDLGLNWSVTKDMRSPFTMMKGKLDSEGKGRTIILPSRASAISSIVMRKGLPDLSVEEGAHLNGGSFLGTSRLDNSLLFSGYRPDQPDGIGKASSQRTLFRTASLPDVNQDHERLSGPPKGLDLLGSGVSRYDRLSFLTSPSHSLTGAAEQSRISRAPLFLHSPTMEVAALTSAPLPGLPLDAPVKYPTPPSLQRSLSSEGTSIRTPVCNDIGMDFGKSQEPKPERQFVTKYRAFPDAYRTKEKEHGKLNPRPGKMVIYDQPGLRGNWIEVHSDVIDATGWKLPESISIRVVRGGWVLYEKPEFKGKKIALDEGNIELTNLFGPQGNDQCPTQNGTGEFGEDGSDAEPDQPRRFAIGSLRRAVRDYSVPEICLFPEEDAEGKKVIFRDTTDDARIYGFPIKANSIIINAGLWLVFAEPFFQGVPRVLEVGGFPKPKSWSDTEPYVSSLHPLKIGEPRVEKLNEPKLVIYEKPYFTGKSREIYTSARDFMTRESQQQTVVMYSAGSIKVIGGIWAGYEKEGFRGHQYLLEEGDYHDWRVWGGCDNELRSVRVIQTDLTEPMLVMFEMTNEEEDRDEERTFEVTEAVPDVELFGFRTVTRSIHVLSGAWVAYSHVDYSGNQYVLEKGFYNNCIDWGAEDNRICSIQPILRASAVGPAVHSELLLYSETGFQGLCQVYNKSHESFLKQPSVQSCRVMGGSWVLYDDTDFMGNQYVLSEGHYVNLTSMGCPSSCTIRSVKSVPMLFAVPSISLFGLECFEGREITLDTEVSNIMAEGFNPHFLSVRVNTGCWVLCEHTNYRGRQFLLEPIEITNWHKFSSISSIGSIYPIRTTQRLFRIRYKESGRFMSVQGGVDTLKSGRVVVSEHVEGMSDIWFYQDGLIKNKLAQNMSLQVIGNVESGAKVVLWSETRTPIQMWSAKLSGAIASLTFPGFVLDVKGGNTYDKEHVIVGNEAEENASELWELEFI
ncbi:beta/gamma crystallin domain-containing protein 2 [Electrophorus electricus]|uniref:beta/gamma crystallin domain-containing protein 2 n=1 Tax=Electrophorus electricus TaxID=8005 RepID=UPI0015CFA8F1|nr:beta/gamma crystallin domain-containing protein 2 [Electrophorus electricus]